MMSNENILDIETLIKEFSINGYDHIDLQILGKKIKNDETFFTRNYDNKYDLFVTLMEYSFDKIVIFLEPTFNKEIVPKFKIIEVLHEFVTYGLTRPHIYLLAMSVRPTIEKFDKHIPVESAVRLRVMLRRLIKELIKKSAISQNQSVELIVQGILCLVNGIVLTYHSLDRINLIDGHELTSYTIQTYVNGLFINDSL